MWGQWIGQFNGTNSGLLTLNIDQDRPYTGRLLVVDSDLQKVSFHAKVSLRVSDSRLDGQLQDFTLSWDSSLILGKPVQELRQHWPQTGEISGEIYKDGGREQLSGNWETDIGTTGAFLAQKYEPVSASPADQEMSWDEFKEWALKAQFGNKGMIFRGHSSNESVLTTSLHRTGRRDLIRYGEDDVLTLHRYIEPTLGRSINVLDPFDYGGLLNLAQHHGYPTPLLDWTDSPFVAAYFAFFTLKKAVLRDENWVRVFTFDTKGWESKHHRRLPDVIWNIAELPPQFRPLRLSVRDNPRAIPHQSVNMFSNVVDIESWIRWNEEQQGQKYLIRIDIPEIGRPKVMKELEIMGITAASLFPGIEGVCRALAEKDF
jgi:hypothetical protein